MINTSRDYPPKIVFDPEGSIEILSRIVSHCNLLTIGRLSRLNHQWNQCMGVDLVWKVIAKRLHCPLEKDNPPFKLQVEHYLDTLRKSPKDNRNIPAASKCCYLGNRLIAGNCYFESKSSDSTQAVDWYREQARKGSLEAHYNLALCLEHGFGVRKDPNAAFESYQKSAEGDLLPQGLYMVGLHYLEGRIVDKSSLDAFAYFFQAGKLGYSPAQKMVGDYYTHGWGTGYVNPHEAKMWYERSEI